MEVFIIIIFLFFNYIFFYIFSYLIVGEIYDSWNLESALGGYAITGFGEVLHAGMLNNSKIIKE